MTHEPLNFDPPPMDQMCCPDCSGVFNEKWHLTHDSTCPLGRAMDAMQDADRDWFLAHPRADEYHRAITPAEVASLHAVGVVAEHTDRVHVVQLAPGLRTRRAYCVVTEEERRG